MLQRVTVVFKSSVEFLSLVINLAGISVRSGQPLRLISQTPCGGINQFLEQLGSLVTRKGRTILYTLILGAADKLKNLFLHAHQEPEVTILGMHKVLAMDSTELDALERLDEKIHRRGKHLILSGPHTQLLCLLEKAGFVEQIGYENLVGDMDDALPRARQLLG